MRLSFVPERTSKLALALSATVLLLSSSCNNTVHNLLSTEDSTTDCSIPNPQRGVLYDHCVNTNSTLTENGPDRNATYEEWVAWQEMNAPVLEPGMLSQSAYDNWKNWDIDWARNPEIQCQEGDPFERTQAQFATDLDACVSAD